MPRKLLQRVLPTRSRLRERWFLRPFNALLHDPALWATHRKNVLKALAVGLFASFLPIPGQTPLAVVVALWLRVNIAVAVLASWLANPLTAGPLYYSGYRLGSWLLDRRPGSFPEAVSFEWLWAEIGRIWQPLLLGSLVLGAIVTAVAVLVLNQVWIRVSRRRFRERRQLQSWRRQGPG
ncbi:MAG: DUF2062 domain-containing protein [Gammaproteobacteria bacterium]|jgi:uncharacterized protein (DUF2062 family)